MTHYILLTEVTDMGLTGLEPYSEDVYTAEEHDKMIAEAQQAWFDGDAVIVGAVVLVKDWEKPKCNHQTYAETLETPAEYCENDTALGSEFCGSHSED